MDDHVFATDPVWIARRLGVSEDLVLRLQRRGVLRSFGLSEAEVRRRLWDRHLRHGAAGAGDETDGPAASA